MEHKRTGLTIFGILWILLGLLCGAMSLTVIAGSMASSGLPGAAPMRMMISTGALYVVIGACFITLGIGSIMARRWSRALILVFSWMWLITGALTFGSVFVIMPKVFASLPPEQAAAKPFMLGCAAVGIALFMVLLPGIMILFYRRPAVKAAVEALDPVPRWTDKPLPLLFFAVWMIGGAVCFLMFSVMYKAFPLGPWMLRGIGLYATMLAIAALMLFIGAGALKQKPAAWWAALAMLVFGAVCGVLLMTKTDIAAWYREMGMATDPRQAEMMQSLYQGPYFIGWLVVFWAAYLGYLWYLRRYFFGQNVNRMYPPST
jgi:hypothetical protein